MSNMDLDTLRRQIDAAFETLSPERVRQLLAQYAKEGCSQAPGNLSEEAEASLKEAWKLPTPNQVANEHRAIHQGNRHYLSGWVAQGLTPQAAYDVVIAWLETHGEDIGFSWAEKDLMKRLEAASVAPPYTPQQEQR